MDKIQSKNLLAFFFWKSVLKFQTSLMEISVGSIVSTLKSASLTETRKLK